MGEKMADHAAGDFEFPISKEAVMTFADAIMAIAVTIMTLEIKLPELPPGHSQGEAINAIIGMYPYMFAYIRTFMAISVSWFFVRWVYSKLENIDMIALLLTLTYLFFGTIWPLAGFIYFTLGGDYMTGDWAANVTAASLQLVFAFAGLLILWYVAGNRRLLARGVTEWEILTMYFVIVSALVIFVLAIVLLFTVDAREYPQIMPWFILVFFNGEILLMAIWQKTLFSKQPRGRYLKALILGSANVKRAMAGKARQTISTLISLVP